MACGLAIGRVAWVGFAPLHEVSSGVVLSIKTSCSADAGHPRAGAASVQVSPEPARRHSDRVSRRIPRQGLPPAHWYSPRLASKTVPMPGAAIGLGGIGCGSGPATDPGAAKVERERQYGGETNGIFATCCVLMYRPQARNSSPGSGLRARSCRSEEEVNGHLRTSPTVSHWAGQ